MGVMISNAAQYAIRALVELAGRPASEAVLIRDIAEVTEVPYPFLAKVMAQLAQKGLIDSFKGPRGGVRLAQPPHKLSVWLVIEAVDGTEAFERCFLGFNTCSAEAACALHQDWKAFRERLQKKLSILTIAELAQSVAGV